MLKFSSILSSLLLSSLIFSTIISAEEFKFYSQYAQDKYLYENIFKGKRNGIFVDIGAHDGITISNTYFFEKHMGWTGMCVEPIPEVFDLLQKNRKCICIKGGVSDQQNTMSFLRIKGWAEMLSGIIDNYDPLHVRRIQQEISQNGGSSEIIKVQCYPLMQLLFQNNIRHIDYLSIDTEGGELKILQSIDFNYVDIDVIEVENNYGSTYEHYLAPFGYTKITTLGPDDIFIKTHKDGI